MRYGKEKTRATRRRQSGVALLVALFALLLLSAIGMGMMYSANTETDINGNFRDKQVADYAALAGLQEARARLAPNGGDIAMPTAFPTASNGQVLYIVADSTVTPWTSGSTYADTELCQERNLADSSTLNLTQGTSGIRCSGAGSMPTGSDWYTSFDDSTTGGVFNLNPPLATKWVRITLKANNSTRVAVDGSGPTSTNATQVCWDGRNQIPVPPGYNTQCSPGTVGSIKVTNGGINYSMTPTITLTGGGGSGATAQAVVTIGSISSLTLTNGGSQYLTTPTVTISPPASGNTATATALISGSVVSVAVGSGVNAGQGCPNNSTIPLIFSGGGGSGAAGTATTDNHGRVSGVTITAGGTGYSAPPAATIDASCTRMPQLTPGISGSVISLTLTYGGSGYISSSPPSVTITPPTGAGGATATATAIVSPPTITAINLVAPGWGGSGYTSAPTVTITDATGSGASATAYLTGGTYYGPVMLVTALAVTPTGARSMLQMEAAPTVRSVSLPGALTLAGPAGPVSLPVYSGPSGSQFIVSGVDQNSCGAATPSPSHPAIGSYDNPNAPTNPTAVEQVIAGIPAGRTGNYVGSGSTTPDVQNVYGSLGDQMGTPAGMEQLAASIASVATNTYSCTGSSCPIVDAQLAPGTPTSPVIDVVNGDLTVSGAYTGYGILLVTGTMTFSGDFGWNGLVFVIGQGDTQMNGGGSNQINGSMIVAKTRDSSGNLLPSLGSPVVNWNGGGGNGIRYDHCLTDKMMGMIPYVPPPTTQPLVVLSTKTLTY